MCAGNWNGTGNADEPGVGRPQKRARLSARRSVRFTLMVFVFKRHVKRWLRFRRKSRKSGRAKNADAGCVYRSGAFRPRGFLTDLHQEQPESRPFWARRSNPSNPRIEGFSTVPAPEVEVFNPLDRGEPQPHAHPMFRGVARSSAGLRREVARSPLLLRHRLFRAGMTAPSGKTRALVKSAETRGAHTAARPKMPRQNRNCPHLLMPLRVSLGRLNNRKLEKSLELHAEHQLPPGRPSNPHDQTTCRISRLIITLRLGT